MQAKTHNLALIAKKIGLNITIEKTKVIRSSRKQLVKIELRRRSKIWISLGSTTTVLDQLKRMFNAHWAHPDWPLTYLVNFNFSIFTTKCNVISVFLYGSVTQRMISAFPNKP